MELELLGIPKQKINQLNKKHIYSIESLVKYFPYKYYDFREPIINFENIQDNNICSIIGTVIEIKLHKKHIHAKILDENKNIINAYWFNQRYVYNMLKPGTKYIFCGRTIIDAKYYNMKKIFPFEFSSNISKLQKIIPVYSKIKGMSDKYLKKIIEDSLKLINTKDYLEDKIKKSFNLISEYDAFKNIHAPQSFENIKDAKKRFIFDDLFVFNFQLKRLNTINKKKTAYPISSFKTWKMLYNKLPFDLTKDQKECLKNMFSVIKQKKQLNTLIQGDVGSGKTIVAIFMMLLMAENNYQSCMMVPTEVLGQQHYSELKKILKDTPFKVGYLSGKLKTKEKKEILKSIELGEIQIVVGTHAIIQKDVLFKRLGLMIVDEQHRFGVVQREKLIEKHNRPHFITMSATPIPRTLSMILYGESTQVLTIKTRPQGRKVVKTYKVEKCEKIYEFLLKEIQKNRQCYIVCPIIEDSSSERMAEVKSANATYKEVKNYFEKFPEIKISFISGKMKKEEVEKEIKDFANNKTQILVSTTIIEVGVNIPNATVMVIKNAERFGLAQLHQLRGRVGRSNWQSYCILQSLKKDDKKIEIMCQTSDGFEIAKRDLEIRGPGDFIGTRQSGQNKYVMLMLAYPKLYAAINKLNDEIYKNSTWYSKYKFINELELE